MAKIKFTHTKKCPYCRTRNLSKFEFIGTVLTNDSKSGRDIPVLKYRYLCHSALCKGREFHSSWGPGLEIIIEDMKKIKQIIRKKQCPLCKQKVVHITKGGSYPGSYTTDDLSFHTYICRNQFCEYVSKKIKVKIGVRPHVDSNISRCTRHLRLVCQKMSDALFFPRSLSHKYNLRY